MGILRSCCPLMGMLSHQGNTGYHRTFLSRGKPQDHRRCMTVWALELVLAMAMEMVLAVAVALELVWVAALAAALALAALDRHPPKPGMMRCMLRQDRSKNRHH